MRSPTVKNLLATFRDLTEDNAKLIRKLAKVEYSGSLLEDTINKHCPETARQVSRMYNNPYANQLWRTTVALHAIDRLLGTYGVETIDPVNTDNMFTGPRFEYCNAGDTYATTLIYDRDNDRLFIGCMGNIAEKFMNEEGE